MPVPPLPLELVRLVFDHLAHMIDSQRERIEMGARLSLVCRAWLGMAQHLAWSMLVVKQGQDEALLQHVLANKGVLALVHHLVISLSKPDAAEQEDHGVVGDLLSHIFFSERFEPNVVELLESCGTNLRTLQIAPDLPSFDVLDVIGEMPYAATLSSLDCVVVYDGPLDTRRLAEQLARHQKLRRLSFGAVFFDASPSDLILSPIDLEQRVPVEHLSLQVYVLGDASPRRGLFDIFQDVLAVNTIRKVDLGGSHAGVFFDLLASFPQLQELKLSMAADALQGCFAHLVNILPELNALRILRAVPRLEYAAGLVAPDVVSPVALRSFLRALPVSIQTVTVASLYFEQLNDVPMLRLRPDDLLLGALGVHALLWIKLSTLIIRAAFGPAPLPGMRSGTTWCIVASHDPALHCDADASPPASDQDEDDGGDDPVEDS
ncbi:uncharacterized protein JCM10292_005566 [Rhodotorula paludigena]|uniref:uncharacterized protein n=1 Tax=Rhodotorula paludigena TaxID=86838 RepID=UPI00318176E4